ncbi:MAG: hypothetical protein MZV63_40495 [Marinilabiliales bacterium]|nr:hypothetical protein [Marinilabiliales bacterium]
MLLLITVFKLIVTREFDPRLLRHPVTVVVALWLTWTLLTSLTSTMPGVSFKTLAYRLWFIAGFYLIAAQLFSSGTFSRRYLIAYSAGLSVVVVFFLIRVGGAGLLNQQFAHSACYPFYRDHTSFGASMAFLLPSADGYAVQQRHRLFAQDSSFSNNTFVHCRFYLLIQPRSVGKPYRCRCPCHYTMAPPFTEDPCNCLCHVLSLRWFCPQGGYGRGWTALLKTHQQTWHSICARRQTYPPTSLTWSASTGGNRP